MTARTEKIFIHLRHTYGSETLRDRMYEEEGDTHTMDEPFGEARFGASRTINLGNFESVRLEVGVTVPCDPNDIPEMIDKAKELCLTKLVEYAAEINEDE